MVAPVAVALLLPGEQAARRGGPANPFDKHHETVRLGLHNYHDSHRQFPARAIADKDGKPLLSSRRSGPACRGRTRCCTNNSIWTSLGTANTTDHWWTKMPAVFVSPNGPPEEDKTVYLAPAVNEPSWLTKGRNMKDITDGLGRTIMLVEVTPSTPSPGRNPKIWKSMPRIRSPGLKGVVQRRNFPGGVRRRIGCARSRTESIPKRSRRCSPVPQAKRPRRLLAVWACRRLTLPRRATHRPCGAQRAGRPAAGRRPAHRTACGGESSGQGTIRPTDDRWP